MRHVILEPEGGKQSWSFSTKPSPSYRLLGRNVGVHVDEDVKMVAGRNAEEMLLQDDHFSVVCDVGSGALQIIQSKVETMDCLLFLAYRLLPYANVSARIDTSAGFVKLLKPANVLSDNKVVGVVAVLGVGARIVVHKKMWFRSSTQGFVWDGDNIVSSEEVITKN